MSFGRTATIKVISVKIHVYYKVYKYASVIWQIIKGPMHFLPQGKSTLNPECLAIDQRN